MTQKPTAVAAALLIATLAHSAAQADDAVSRVKISGYGTVAGVVTDDSDRQFVADVTRSKGASDKLDIGQDSRLGLQASVDFQRGLSATGQIVAKRRMINTTRGDDKDFDMAVEWFYGQYDFTSTLNLRLGRMATPTFLLSDSLNIGYSANWLRAPVHLYTSVPFNTFDGAELNYAHSLSGYNVSAQLAYGNAKTQLATAAGVTPISTTNLTVLNVIVEHGNWLGRVGALRSTAPLPFGNVIDTYKSAGFQYDNGAMVVMTEVAKRTQNDLPFLLNHPVQTATYAYLAAGWRFGKVLPMAMVSYNKIESNLPAGPGRITSLEQSRTAPSLVLRYDVAPNIALKAQLDQYKADDTRIFAPAATDDHAVRVLTAGIDFLF